MNTPLDHLNTLVKVQFGAHLYGTQTETSDQDLKGVYIPQGRDIVLQNIKNSYRYSTKQEREQSIEGALSKNLKSDLDYEVFALKYFFDLLNEADPMALDLLFTNQDSIIRGSLLWDKIQKNRHRLICRQVTKSIKYCQKQAAQYGGKGTRVSECRVLREIFEKAQEKRPSARVEDYRHYFEPLIQDMSATHLIERPHTNGTTEKYLECCNKKISYKTTVKIAFQILDSFYKKYGERALKAEKNQGIDWKALSHAVRVGYQIQELLDKGTITFPRPEAYLLLQIKCGKLDFKTVSTLLDYNERFIQDSYLRSDLPDTIDVTWCQNFVCETYGCSVLEMQL